MSQDIVRVQIGKQGLTSALLSEIRKHLKAKKSVKVRFLKAALGNQDRKQLASELKDTLKVKGTLVGNVFSIKNG
ncbi:RNA-binding protein [Candidatus Woesearchaeota archaeon]|jgi:RNA-binding protein YhbY|nr:RNA-binding protein [Candidatus Woesearchaeota archaeon]MBT4368410.1 RNA-binding protein [Candidatus Woesearchaeota archaeon]MBT4712899.1 RNA-binding protein [Candidatus Woesearchaeota archaeon]MBT6639811.1 RNA-binding protein [Candidatus Woesearchaeota archaeon]MBT7133983.1 RNA-binding protein [Candidatus Woesearchaeota archaeon]